MIRVAKRRRCLGCGYDKTVAEVLTVDRLTHQDQEMILGQLKFEQLPYDKNGKHKHHFKNVSWIEVMEGKNA